MSFYWRSPYKESKTGGSQGEAKTTPYSGRSVRSANSRFSEPVSPQDWFDASLAALKTQSLSPRRGTIKGILKESPSVGDSNDNITQSLDSAASFEDAPAGKKAKKKVTFGVQSKEASDRHNDFQAFRSTSAHQFRLQNREPLDEFARQNLRKLLGYAPAPTSLPSLSGKAMLPVSDGVTPPASANSQSSRAQLATPPTDSSMSKRSFQMTPTYLDSGGGLAALTVDGVMATPEPFKDTDEETNDVAAREPKKSVRRHWTKSFTKPTEKKRLCRHLAGRYPMSAGTLHKNMLFRKMSNDKTPSANEDMSKEFLKLRISGGDTVLGLTTSSHDPDQKLLPSQGSARSESHGSRGYKIPATLTQLPETNGMSGGLRFGPSANQLHIKYGTPRLEARDKTMKEQQYDKTAQILSWLQDVKQKEGFQPRNSRLYALELQQQH